MSYTALYRKFRPSTFDDVKGQDHIVTTLKNQIRSEKIQHAYLFCGTRGTGKTSVAKLLAKAINCEHPVDGNPCMECDSCRAIADGKSMNVVEIDAASNNGVDNVRQIIEEVSYPPTDGKYKVYIIDEVHMLSIGAFNALLKTIEEPPSYVVFILATTEAHKLPVTILSRCQRYDFRRISVEDIEKRIAALLPGEGIEADEAAIRYIAKCADGALRDAWSLLDQCIAFNFGKKLTYEAVLDTLGAVDSTVFSDMLRVIVMGDVSDAVMLLEKLIMDGRDLSQFVSDFIWYIRNILLAITGDDISEVVDMSKDNLERLMVEARNLTADMAMRYIRILSELSNKLRYATDKRVLTELAIIKLCRPETESNEDTILSRIRVLEKKLESGDFSPSVMPALNDETPKAPEAPVILPSAVPEDIQNVIKNWHEVLAQLESVERASLKNMVPSLGPSDELVLYFKNPTNREFFLSSQYGRLEKLQAAINRVAKAEVPCRLELDKTVDEVGNSVIPNLLKIFMDNNVPCEQE